MSQLLLFALLMCDQTGLGAPKCLELHTKCLLNISKDKYIDKPSELCDKGIANLAWAKTKIICK